MFLLTFGARPDPAARCVRPVRGHLSVLQGVSQEHRARCAGKAWVSDVPTVSDIRPPRAMPPPGNRQVARRRGFQYGCGRDPAVAHRSPRRPDGRVCTRSKSSLPVVIPGTRPVKTSAPAGSARSVRRPVRRLRRRPHRPRRLRRPAPSRRRPPRCRPVHRPRRSRPRPRAPRDPRPRRSRPGPRAPRDHRPRRSRPGPRAPRDHRPRRSRPRRRPRCRRRTHGRVDAPLRMRARPRHRSPGSRRPRPGSLVPWRSDSCR
jgi:hypothetical protein